MSSGHSHKTFNNVSLQSGTLCFAFYLQTCDIRVDQA